MDSQKTKTRSTLSKIEKNEIIKWKENNKNSSYEDISIKFSKKFNKSISARYIGDICRTSKDDVTLSLFQRKSSKKPENEDLEKCLMLWIDQNNQKGMSLSEDLIREKALLVAEEMQIQHFKASNGWIYNFKKRNNLCLYKLSGESKSYNLDNVDVQIQELQNMLKSYEMRDIFNMDETALVYKEIPSRTISSLPRTGIKQLKSRLTVALCSNSDGSYKTKPLVIGISKSPRCFTGFNISNYVTYYNNRKAWMTTEIFQNWLKKFNSDMAARKRNVVLLLDNASCHKDLHLSNVVVAFLPKNTTGVFQPMDAGIIRSFKSKYRKRFLRNLIREIEKKNDCSTALKSINLAQAIVMIKEAWIEVTPECIKNCWSHTKILPLHTEDGYVGHDEDINDLRDLISIIDADAHIAAEVFVNFDNNIETTEQLTIQEIISIFHKKEDENQDVDDECDDSHAMDCPTIEELNKAFITIDKFFMFSQKPNLENVTNCYLKFKSNFENIFRKKTRQTTIDEFYYK